MSEYYLADHKADERARRRVRDREVAKVPTQAQDIKITLLGDFLFRSNEPQGFDPYNHVNGKTLREAGRSRRERR
jgi:hypothetical protein